MRVPEWAARVDERVQLMGLWEAMRARSRPRRNDLDALFLVPSAAITLETSLGYLPVGEGSVCYRSAVGAGFARTQDDVMALLRDQPDAPEVRISQDSYGFTWLVVDGDPADVSRLCTDIHAVNTTLELNGFDSGLLCSTVPFANEGGQRFALVYLYKQGTFYAFAPSGHQQRDNLLEIGVRDALTGELPMEQDMQRWLALWDAPGL